MKKTVTALDPFREEEARINADVAESEKHYDRVIRDQEKIRDTAKGEREKAAAVLAGMIADFEAIEAEQEAEARANLDAQGLTTQALEDGRLSAAEYFKRGISDSEATAKASTAAAEKMADLIAVTRAQAKKVLELEAEELDAEYNIAFAQQAPAAAFRERLAALVKALETSLASPLGVTGGGVKYARDAKKAELQIATIGRLPGSGSGWQDYDLAGLKRLRLSPIWPADQLPKLESIIAESKASGRGCRILHDTRDRKNPVQIMWS